MTNLAFRGLPPLIVTYQELLNILQPITMGYAWGENTIRDLWKIGAPTPDSTPGTVFEKRIVFPGMLAKWLEDVCSRKGQPLDVGAKAYANLLQLSH